MTKQETERLERLEAAVKRIELAIGSLANGVHGVADPARLAAQHPEMAHLLAQYKETRG